MEGSAKIEGRLADIEVKALLQEREAKVGGAGKNDPNRSLSTRLRNRDYIMKETFEYMKNSTLPDNATGEMVTTCFAMLKEKGFELTEAELISIVNHVPMHDAEILTVIPTFEQRYPEGMEDLKDIIAESFKLDLGAPEGGEEN